MLAAANAEGPGMRLADLETSSAAAYQHYVAALNLDHEGHLSEAVRELDAAIALDSGFISALQERWRHAMASNETEILARLLGSLRLHGARATPYERLEQQALAAYFNGEHELSEALARQLVQRYPRDPRSYALLVNFLDHHGRWDVAEEVARAALAIDSLGTGAGVGGGRARPVSAMAGSFRSGSGAATATVQSSPRNAGWRCSPTFRPRGGRSPWSSRRRPATTKRSPHNVAR